MELLGEAKDCFSEPLEESKDRLGDPLSEPLDAPLGDLDPEKDDPLGEGLLAISSLASACVLRTQSHIKPAAFDCSSKFSFTIIASRARTYQPTIVRISRDFIYLMKFVVSPIIF